MEITATERGILMSGRLVRPTLDGSKTQTRRPMGLKDFETFPSLLPDGKWHPSVGPCFTRGITCPFGKVGDVLYVRETFYCDHCPPMTEADRVGDWREQYMFYRADAEKRGCITELMPEPGELDTFRWTPSIHMPKWASRIKLLIKDIRVERIQDISPEDCIAEGITSRKYMGRYGEETGWNGDWSRVGELSLWADGSCATGKRLKAPLIEKDIAIGQPKYAFGNMWDEHYGKDKAKSWESNCWCWVVEYEVMK